MGTRDVEGQRSAVTRQTGTRVAGEVVTGESEGRHAGLTELQRLVGNRTVSQMLADGTSLSLGAAGVSALRRQLSPPRGEPRAVVPALDATAEADADRIAERAIRRSRASETTSERAWPSRIPTPLAEALAPDLGDVRSVEIRSGGAAARSADAIGAVAYSEPGTVTVGSGAPALGSPQGRRLLAHEAVHAVRHGSRSDPQGRQLVHAKLAGTADALIAQGGAKTTPGIRKVVGERTHWDRIIDKLRRYEQYETMITDRYKNLQRKRPLSTPAVNALIDMLLRVEAACNDWRTANNEPGAQALADQWHASARAKKRPGEDALFQPDDTRDKAARRQAIAMLLPRIRSEMASLAAGTWLLGMTLSDPNITAVGQSDAGAMNKVVGQQYATEQGPFSGFFKEDKGFESKPVGHDLETGITQADPNYGARAVAMSRIDQLLKTNLMARTEFATSGGKMGTVSEAARGTRGDKLLKSFVLTTKERNRKRKAGQPVISLEDPVLQKALNQMQIIDAICGQLDRHAGNWFVETDKKGNVTGVKGMDLDMAFGRDLLDPDGKEAKKAAHYRGMPQMVDADLGARILQLTAKDIETAVEGLLGDDEVRALVARFKVVQGKILAVQHGGGLISTWSEKTAASSRPKSVNDMMDSDRKTYQQNLHFEALAELRSNVQAAINFNRTAEINKYLSDTAKECLDEFPDAKPQQQRVKLFNTAVSLVMEALYARVVKGAIEPDSALAVGWQMMDALLAALGKDDTTTKKIKSKFKDAKPINYHGIAKELMQPLCGPAFAKRKFGATPPPKARQTSNA